MPAQMPPHRQRPLTRSYGSSYAVSAAQQAYQQQMGALNDALPSLYRLALDTYNSEGDDVVTRIDQLNAQEQNAQARYNAELSDYYSQLDRKGSAYNAAYEQDYGRYQTIWVAGHPLRLLLRAGTAGACQTSAGIQQCAECSGVIGDAVQPAITGTTGIGSLMGSLANTGYNMYAKDRAYEAERADAAWSQQMQENQRQDSLAQQKYKNELAERQYQDTLQSAGVQQQCHQREAEHCQGRVGAQAVQGGPKRPAGRGKRRGKECGRLGRGAGADFGRHGRTYSAARLYRQGRSDTAIRSELLKEATPTKRSRIS